jgi:hypothetical protein
MSSIPLYYLLRPQCLEKSLVKSLLAPGPLADGSRMTTVFVCLHVPVDQPLAELTGHIKTLATGLDAVWDYRFGPGDNHGAFHLTVKELRS